MVIINKKDLKDTHRANTDIVIDLDGPDGNAYVLMAYAIFDTKIHAKNP